MVQPPSSRVTPGVWHQLVPHLVGGVHHLQQDGLLVHQLLRGVGVLCKEKGGREDGLGCPVFSKAKAKPWILGAPWKKLIPW